MGRGVGVVGVDSHLGLEGRARQVSVVGLCPTLASGLPALVDRHQVLVASLATGSQTASLTGDSCLSYCSLLRQFARHHLQTIPDW